MRDGAGEETREERTREEKRNRKSKEEEGSGEESTAQLTRSIMSEFVLYMGHLDTDVDV